MSGRDDKGRFIKGRVESDEEKLNRLIAVEKVSHLRKNYIKDLKDENPKIYGVWRGIRFTKKGKKAGCSEEWHSFKTFYNDVSPTYKVGLLFRRLDTTKPYSKDNFMWVTQEEVNLLQSNLVWLEYEGETLPLKDLAIKYNVNLNGLKIRYFKRHLYNYTIEEIIFGRKKNRGSKTPINAPTSRSKASKMIASYKHKDNKNNVPPCDMDIDWFIENISTKPCVYCGDTNRVGCDRIDNSKGHTKDNVVPCCFECNCARNNNFSYEEMLIIGKTIKKVKELRKSNN